MQTVIGTFKSMIPQYYTNRLHKIDIEMQLCNGETCVKRESKVRTE